MRATKEQKAQWRELDLAGVPRTEIAKRAGVNNAMITRSLGARQAYKGRRIEARGLTRTELIEKERADDEKNRNELWKEQSAWIRRQGRPVEAPGRAGGSDRGDREEETRSAGPEELPRTPPAPQDEVGQ